MPGVFDLDPALFQRRDAGDDHLLVVFYMGTLKNEERTIEEGRLIVDDVECVKIIVPGDKTSIIDRPATPRDKQRFAQQYAAYKQGKEGDAQISGTRLTDWPFLSRGQVEELNYLGIKTVEQVANLADSVNYTGLQQLKQHAKSWLAATKDSALAAQQADKMNEQANKIETLQKALEDQAAQIKALQVGRKQPA